MSEGEHNDASPAQSNLRGVETEVKSNSVEATRVAGELVFLTQADLGECTPDVDYVSIVVKRLREPDPPPVPQAKTSGPPEER